MAGPLDLCEKYKPTCLDELLGQEWVKLQLSTFAEEPYPCAFLFEGGSGTGKTSAAILLAKAIGVDVDNEEFGGLWIIASGEQTAETVRKTTNGLRVRPWSGSGWRMLIVNEADAMTTGAAMTWLDALEDLPPMTVICFTTNHSVRLPPRFRDRCERLRFEGSALLLRPALQELADRVWAAEVGGPAPDVEAFGPIADENGEASFRRLLRTMTPFVRARTAPATATKPAPTPTTKPKIDRSAAARKAWATMRRRKELVA